MGEGKVGIELHRAFETFDCLTQAIGRTPCGIVSAGSVKLLRFFVRSRFRIRSRSFDGSSNRAGFTGSWAARLPRRSLGNANSTKIRISGLLDQFFKFRPASERIPLGFHTKPDQPAFVDSEGLTQQ